MASADFDQLSMHRIENQVVSHKKDYDMKLCASGRRAKFFVWQKLLQERVGVWNVIICASHTQIKIYTKQKPFQGKEIVILLLSKMIQWFIGVPIYFY